MQSMYSYWPHFIIVISTVYGLYLIYALIRIDWAYVGWLQRIVIVILVALLLLMTILSIFVLAVSLIYNLDPKLPGVISM